MNKLTLELFQSVAGAVLDEDGRQRVFAWLSALIKMPYLNAVEKQNALILLDYLDGLEGGEIFVPMYKAARTKLSFKAPRPWDMEWPENYQVCVNGEKLTPEDLRRRGIEYVDFQLTKPIRNSTEYTVTRRLYSDGTVEFLTGYKVFAAPPAGERHLFHAYGEKAAAKWRQL